MSSYFGFCAIFMLWLATFVRSQELSQSGRSKVLPPLFDVAGDPTSFFKRCLGKDDREIRADRDELLPRAGAVRIEEEFAMAATAEERKKRKIRIWNFTPGVDRGY
jgi:hypothetical protein